LRSLFDLSFTSFVTTRLMKVLYVAGQVLATVAYALIAHALFSAGESATVAGDPWQGQSGGGTGLAVAWLLVIGPLFLLLHAIVSRVLCELVVVLFRIHEHTRDQLAITREAWAPAVDASRPGGGRPPLTPPV